MSAAARRSASASAATEASATSHRPAPELGRDVGVADHRRACRATRPRRPSCPASRSRSRSARRRRRPGSCGAPRRTASGREDDGCRGRRFSTIRRAARSCPRRRSPRRRRGRPTPRAPRGTAAAASRGSSARSRRTAAARARARPAPAASAASSTSSSMPFQTTSTAGAPCAGTTPCSSSRRAKCDDGAVTASDLPANRRRYDQPSRPRRLRTPARRRAPGAARRSAPAARAPGTARSPRSDIDPVVHRVHHRQPVPRGEPVADERAPEVGLHVHDVDRRAVRHRGVEEPVGAPARPRESRTRGRG